MSDWTKQNQAVARLRLIADQDHTETSRTKRLDADACRVAADYVVSLEAQRDAAFLAGVRAGLERAAKETDTACSVAVVIRAIDPATVEAAREVDL